MDNSLISIIVPVYNVEKYLPKCIDSILAQTHRNIQLILVDDESPDNCPAICDEYAKKDERVTVIHKKNAGVYLARNAGLDAAKGDYIGFVDSDDTIDSCMYEKLLYTLKNSNADISMCSSKMVDEYGEEIYTGGIRPTFAPIMHKDAFMPLVLLDRISGHLWNKLFKASIWTDIRFTEMKSVQDLFMIPYIFEKAESIAFLDEQLYFYFGSRTDNISNLKKGSEITQFNRSAGFRDRYVYSLNNYPEMSDECLKNAVSYSLGAYRLIGNSKNTYAKEIREFFKKYKKDILKSKEVDIARKAAVFGVINCPSLFLKTISLIRK